MQVSTIRHSLELPTVKEGEKVKLTYSNRKNTITACFLNCSGDSKPIKPENTPKEFKQINSPSIFHAFFKDIFIQVHIMSDGEPHLYIHQRGKGGVTVHENPPSPSPTGIEFAEAILTLVEQGQQELKTRTINLEGILLVGRTGAGKSTLGNLLNGCEATPFPVGHEWKIHFKKPLFPVSHSLESCTRLPNTHSPDKDKTWIDYAGFDDTGKIDGKNNGGRALIDTANAFFRKEVLNTVDRFKIVFVVHYTDVAERGNQFLDTFQSLIDLLGFNDIQDMKLVKQLASSICLVVTHFPSPPVHADDKENRRAARMQLKERAKTLQPFLNSILTDIINGERWDLLSLPHGNQHLIDAGRIADLIEKKTTYSNKSDAKIEVKVAQKHLGTIQSAIADIMDALKGEFSKNIFDDITTHIRTFYETHNEQEIAAYQKHYQTLIQSTHHSTLSTLLTGFNVSPASLNKVELVSPATLKKAEHYDKLLKLLIDLLPKSEAAKFPYSRDWIEDLYLRAPLEQWNQYMLKTTVSPKVKCKNGRITLHHHFPKLSQVTSALHKYKDVKEIEIHALHTVEIDTDLDLLQQQLQGVNIIIIAPRWEIKGQKRMNLSGKQSTTTHAQATSGDSAGKSGENGNAGTPGANGSDFFGLGTTFSNNTLTITSNGGKGGPGQDGGNGYEGATGEKGTENLNFFIGTLEGIRDEGTRISRGCDWVEQPRENNGKYDMRVRNWGQPGKQGGDGGKGGIGGQGGHAGRLNFISLAKTPPSIHKVASTSAGDHGRHGKAAPGGLRGQAWGGTWHYPPAEWNEHPECKRGYYDEYKDGPRDRANPGYQPKGLEWDSAKTPTAPPDKGAWDIHRLLFNYRKFTTKKGDPLSSPLIEKFRKEYDSNATIRSKMTVDNLVDECDKMEELSTRMIDKTKCLPLYEAMAERLRTFIALNPKSKDIVLIQCLYTYTLSTICRLNAAKDSRLIIDMNGFLELVKTNIKDLENLNHNNQIQIYQRQYDESICGKIDQADFFIKKLYDDIKAANKDLDDQIEALLKEIADMKKQNQTHKEKLAAEEVKLKELIERKKMFGALSMAVQLLGCCFPPTGAFVAEVFSASLTAWGNPNALPGIVTSTLNPYLGAMQGVLAKQPGALQDAHQQALARLRMLTTTVATYDLADSPNSTDEQRLQQIKKAMQDIDDQQVQLDAYKKTVESSFKNSLHEVVDSAEKMQQALANQTIIALDFSRLEIRRAFQNVIIQVKAATKSFQSKDGFIHIIRQMEEAIQTTADIYERVQEYQERRELVRYMALIAAPTTQDGRIQTYKEKVLRNVVLEQYALVLAASRQWAFPFGSDFTKDLALLDSFVKGTSIPDLIKHVGNQLDLLSGKVATNLTVVNGRIDKSIWTEKFSSENPPVGPFYIWDFVDQSRQITKLLKGAQKKNNEPIKPTVLFADVSRSKKEEFQAIKFTSIELRFTCGDVFLQDDLSKIFKGVRVEMQHSGISYYAHEGKVYQMINERGFTLGYRMGTEGSNLVMSKIRGGDYMLSPYTHWAITLDAGPCDLHSKVCALLENDLSGLQIELIGTGRYFKP